MSVEQLRADLTDCINAKLETWRELDAAKAEIERLRAEVVSWTAMAGEQRARAEQGLACHDCREFRAMMEAKKP